MLRSVTREWSASFAEYTSRLPTYYWTPLRQALMRCDLNNHVPNLGRDGLGYTRALRNNLKRLKQLGIAELAALQAACSSDLAVRATGTRTVVHACVAVVVTERVSRALAVWFTSPASRRTRTTTMQAVMRSSR